MVKCGCGGLSVCILCKGTGENVPAGTHVLILWERGELSYFHFDRPITDEQVWQHFRDDPKYKVHLIKQIYPMPTVTRVEVVDDSIGGETRWEDNDDEGDYVRRDGYGRIVE